MIQKRNVSDNLTAKQKGAAEHYAIHGDKTAAYRSTYSSERQKPATVNRNAHRLFDIPHVAEYVQTLQEAARGEAILERREALEILSRIVRDERVAIKDRIAAIDRVSKLEGWDAAVKIDHGGVIFNINTSSD